MLVINDGSTDRTPAIIDELRRLTRKSEAIHHDRNRGYGGALQTGFMRNRKRSLVFYTDGDGQYGDLNELTRLLPLMNEGVRIVNGYKARRADGRGRQLLGGTYNRLRPDCFLSACRSATWIATFV